MRGMRAVVSSVAASRRLWPQSWRRYSTGQVRVQDIAGTVTDISLMEHESPDGTTRWTEWYTLEHSGGSTRCCRLLVTPDERPLAGAGEDVIFRLKVRGRDADIVSRRGPDGELYDPYAFRQGVKVLAIERRGPHKWRNLEWWDDWYTVEAAEGTQHCLRKAVFNNRVGQLCLVGETVCLHVADGEIVDVVIPEGIEILYGMLAAVVRMAFTDDTSGGGRIVEHYYVEIRTGVTRDICRLPVVDADEPLASVGAEVKAVVANLRGTDSGNLSTILSLSVDQEDEDEPS
eukprot:Hpha_TRINITY_DN16739_c5_g3::TRINITY_DN16739_c5_g3_i1::g.76614::m.76614